MTEAYDLKDLGEKAKAAGLDIAEDSAGKLYLVIKAWFQESAALSKNPFDDIVSSLLPQIDAVVLPQIDKIDSKVG